MTPLRVFVGFDSTHPLPFYVCASSILRRASVPVSITPLALTQLKREYTRGRGPTESTEFSITRFLVPYLSGFEGRSIYLDADCLCLGDVAELARIPLVDVATHADLAVLVVKHDYVPKAEMKMGGKLQTVYARKNWSSVVLFNNERCRALSPPVVNTAPGLYLHRFLWLKDDEIGELGAEWNFLVGEFEKRPVEELKMLHFTLGTTDLLDYRHCDYADLWWAEFNAMMGDDVGVVLRG